MLVLGIESSCDETSAAIIEAEQDKLTVKSNIIASQIETHRLYGGVVPEIASRAHTEAVARVTREALEQAGCKLGDVGLIGVTNRPGLIGALLVGVNFAKSLAYANGIPLVGVQHICGHMAANYFSEPPLRPPYLSLVASGGHTSLVFAESYTDFRTVGRTRDDAIGEAFDKVARNMGLPYPGGREMDRLAAFGDPEAIAFPSAAISGDNLDFSFSGLKTSVINYLHRLDQKGEPYPMEDIAASFTRSVVTSVIKKLSAAIEELSPAALAIAGGVAANSHLRAAVSALAEEKGLPLYMPPLPMCGDNGAMIAAQAYFDFLAGKMDDCSLNASAVHDL